MSSWGSWGLHTAADEDYRDQHQAPGPESGAPMHDVTQGIYPDTFYNDPFHYWGSDEETGESDSWDTVHRVRGNPDAKVKIHRALPLDVVKRERGIGLAAPLNTGDWVTPSYDYAHGHGESRFGEKTPWTVVTSVVPASQLHTNGDSLAEWGYNGPATKGYERAPAAGKRKYRERKQKTESDTARNFHHCGFCGSPSGAPCERGCWGKKKYPGERDVRGELPDTPGVSGGGEIDYDPDALRDIRLSHRSTDGIRYAQVVEADVAEDLHRMAMPNPLPQGVHFRYHPELMLGPGVTAHYKGKQIGSLEWYHDDHIMVAKDIPGFAGSRKPGEIDRISVHPDHQRNSVASSMFDFAKQHEPRLHHSDTLTEDGRGWSEYEKSRNARLAMAWDQWAPKIEGYCKGCSGEDDYGEYFIKHDPGEKRPGDDGLNMSSMTFYHDTGKDGQPEVGIAGLHTDSNHRSDGVAEALLRRLHDDHPGMRINPGFMTDDGQAFHDRMLDKEPDARSVVTAGRNGDLPPLTFEPFNTMWSNGIMARHAADGRPVGHLHWVPRGEIDSITVHPELQRRGIGSAMLKHAQNNPDQYPSTYPIFHSQNLSTAGRAWAAADGHHLPDEQVYKADDDPANWGFTAVDKYTPISQRYNGQNEDEMSRHLEQPWTPPSHTASTSGDGWPVWWRGRHRPAGDFDDRWSPNHPQRIPAPWGQ